MTGQRLLLVHSRLPVPAEPLRAWHAREGATVRLDAPWDPDGPPRSGWQHRQEIEPADDGAALRDRIAYTPPGFSLGELVGGEPLGDRLLRLFAHRHRQLRRDLDRHARADAAGLGPITIAISGASGLIGRALSAFLTSGGHQVRPLVRPRPGHVARTGEIRWDPQAGHIDRDALAGVQAVVHLAAENLAAGRWTPERKRRIRDSRVKGTDLLARALAGLTPPPAVLISVSAVGIYGLKPAGEVDERSATGDDFLAEVARQWEAAAAPAADRGIRVAHPRLASVLDPGGGALAKLLPVYRAGLGGRLGGGEQPFPWVALDDAVGAIHQGLFDRTLAGPYNVAAPEVITNAKFSEVLARTLGRPAILPVPGFALKVAFGEMASVVLEGPRVLSTRLEQAGFRFLHPSLAPALEQMLGRGPLPATTGSEQQTEAAL